MGRESYSGFVRQMTDVQYTVSKSKNYSVAPILRASTYQTQPFAQLFCNLTKYVTYSRVDRRFC